MLMTKQITKNFNYEEFFESATALQKGILNTPSVIQLGFVFANITKLAFLLQRIRDRIEVPLAVTSGYRCIALNEAVGGVPDSRHLYGAAADLQCGKMSVLKHCLLDLQQKLVVSNVSMYDKVGNLKPRTFNHCIKVIDEKFWFHVQLQESAAKMTIDDFVNLVNSIVL